MKLKREQAITNRARNNLLVNLLMLLYYLSLYHQLVKSDSDLDIFNDTYLNMTTTYKPNRPFNVEFARLFNNLKIEFRKKDSLYKLVPLEYALPE